MRNTIIFILVCVLSNIPRLSNGQTAKEYYNEGLALFNARNYAQALSSFSKAIAGKPNFAEAFFYRGFSKFMLKDSGATADFNQAIALKPEYPRAYLYRGLVRFRRKAYEEAILDFNMAIRLKPDMEDPYFYKGDCEMEIKNYDSAILYLDKAIQLRPDYTGAIYTKGLTELLQEKYEPAENDFTKAIALDSTYSNRMFMYRGLTRIELKKDNEACSDFEKSLQAGCKEAADKIRQFCR